MNTRFILPLLVAALVASLIPAKAQSPQPDKVTELLSEAQSLQGRKRYLDAFSKLDEAEKLNPKRPEIYNIRGAIYLAAAVRDVDKAREQFSKAHEMQPDAMPPLFNLAETEFVSGKWVESEKRFGDILTKFPKLPLGVRHLVTFKVLVSRVKQQRFDEAEKMIKETFSFMDDTPAYYFSKAVVALEKKDEQTGNDWLAKAQIIFKKADTSSYIDSMMESHYIDSLGVSLPQAEVK